MVTIYEVLLLLELTNAILISILMLTGKVRAEELKNVRNISMENNRIVKRINNTVNSSENQSNIQSKKID
ncbi:hypothetical protein DSM106972_025290 [Dulcicalothrix desertica PCC 7102]|uniref:Uncharacterized protein n=1 Tax=Dulcicalothrix desertica PCC 7102 TaxID=232991 RepID=A0A433VMB8_9CYAN|nr:hypothetical protein [Dulcicalothrix desertica]RUT07268.1 hypothetical protein DSM106972_025290 [Dulcicalothrix desertica PCC 7102]TWH55529.1 hypothetical protein CAL7102_03673 [Dulcicalothrix desertica PCC 7102]